MSTDTQSIASLIERVGKAEGADREIDADLHLLLGQEPNEHYREPWRRPILLAPEHQRPGVLEYVEFSGVSARAAPAYTASLDSTLALVERVLPGCWLDVEREFVYNKGSLRERCVGRIRVPRDAYLRVVTAPTPTLALLLAALKAKAEQP